MKNNFFQYLSCPACYAQLRENRGNLICKVCDKKYEIKNGIPILIDLSSMDKHLKDQIRYFEKDRATSSFDYTLLEWQKRYLVRFNENFKNVKDKLVFDCGTGSGYMAIELAKQGAYVIATDLTLHSLIRLKKIIEKEKLEDRIYLVCCSAEELPIKDKSIDYFVANAVFEHLQKEKEAIEEVDRICKGSSGFMIAVPLSYKYLLPIFWLVNYIHDKRIGHLRRYNKDSLVKKFKNWRLKRTYYTGHFKKAFKLLVNIIIKLFDEIAIEDEDAKWVSKKYGATNIICFFQRKN